MSNMKQLGLGVMQYSQDYDEQTMPKRIYLSGSQQRYFAWSHIIQPYLKSTQVLACPSSTGKTQSIAYNGALGSSYGEAVSTATPFPERRLSSLPIPAQTVQFMDCVGSAAMVDGGGIPQSPFFQVARASAGGDVLGRMAREDANHSNSYSGWPRAGAHLEGANYLFADGHVKWLTPEYDVDKNSANTGTIPTDIQRDSAFIGPHRLGVSYVGLEVGTSTLYN